MKFICKLAAVLCLLGLLLSGAALMNDKSALSNNLIRLHVIANSDSQEDQMVKLKVRDAVLEEIRGITEIAADRNEAYSLLTERLPGLQETANRVLQAQGSTAMATVELGEEAYPTRQYDTFSLPAGVYDSLRITIGDGEGQNWWCVVFPGLCLPTASDEVADTAVSAGFSEDLGNTLTTQDGYQVRFFLLDCIGWVENFFFNLS